MTDFEVYNSSGNNGYGNAASYSGRFGAPAERGIVQQNVVEANIKVNLGIYDRYRDKILEEGGQTYYHPVPVKANSTEPGDIWVSVGEHDEGQMMGITALNGLFDNVAAIYPNDEEMQRAVIESQLFVRGIACMPRNLEQSNISPMASLIHGTVSTNFHGELLPGQMVGIHIPSQREAKNIAKNAVHPGSNPYAKVSFKALKQERAGKAMKKHLFHMVNKEATWKEAMNMKMRRARALYNASFTICHYSLLIGLLFNKHLMDAGIVTPCAIPERPDTKVDNRNKKRETIRRSILECFAPAGSTLRLGAGDKHPHPYGILQNEDSSDKSKALDNASLGFTVGLGFLCGLYGNEVSAPDLSVYSASIDKNDRPLPVTITNNGLQAGAKLRHAFMLKLFVNGSGQAGER